MHTVNSFMVDWVKKVRYSISRYYYQVRSVMGTKRFTAGLAAAVLCLGLTGCGENVIPELTDHDTQIIGEYAAITLMKYDASNRSRLVTLPPEKETDVPAQTEPEAPVNTEEPSGMKPVEDTPVTDLPGQEEPGSMEEVLELAEGLSVSYVDAALLETYPEGDELGVFVTKASEGKKLLVLRFQFANGTEQDQLIDIASQVQAGLSFRITVNESYRRNAMFTGLLDDMAILRETIPAGASKEAVLIIEVEQGSMEEITSISLNLKNEAKAYTIQLK